MEKFTLKEFIQHWLILNADAVGGKKNTYENQLDIAFNMRDDIRPHIEGFCPSSYSFEDWYDLFIDVCIIPELQEVLSGS